jgi:hypothetical protein
MSRDKSHNLEGGSNKLTRKDFVPVDPFARSLANLETVIGQFYLAITVARLVTLEIEDRRRKSPS